MYLSFYSVAQLHWTNFHQIWHSWFWRGQILQASQFVSMLLQALLMLSRTRLGLGDNDYYNIKHIRN